MNGPVAGTPAIGFTSVSGPLNEAPDWLATHVIRKAEPEPGVPSNPVQVPVMSAGAGDVVVPELLPQPAPAPMRTTIIQRYSVFIACPHDLPAIAGCGPTLVELTSGKAPES